MPFVPTVDTVRADVLWDLDGQHCDNTLWFLHDAGAPDIAAMIDLGDALNTYWIANMLVLQSFDCVYRGCVITDQSSESGASVLRPSGLEAGGVAEASEANNVNICIKFSTAARGRSSHGRNYFGALPTTEVDRNTVEGSYLANIVTAYAGLSSMASSHGFTWVVVSHRTAGADRAAGLAQTIVAVSTTDATVDSQRRRLPGRGN